MTQLYVGISDSDQDEKTIEEPPASPRGTKHLLTPESKFAAEGKPKRLVGTSQGITVHSLHFKNSPHIFLLMKNMGIFLGKDTCPLGS